MLNDEKMTGLKRFKIDYAQVSLEGMEKKNDEIRSKGTFKKITKAVRLLVKNEINTGIQ